MDREILAKAATCFARESEIRPDLLVHKGHQGVYPVRRMCNLLDVSPSANTTGSSVPKLRRAGEDAMLFDRTRLIHQRTFGTYGVPRINSELCESGKIRQKLNSCLRQRGNFELNTELASLDICSSSQYNSP